MNSIQFLHIDHSIRDWVLFPLVIIVLLFTLIRDYLNEIFNSKPQLLKNELDYTLLKTENQQKTFKNTQKLQQAQLLQMHGQYLPKNSFEARRIVFTHPDEGLLFEKFPTVNLSQLTDPNQVFGALKGNLLGIVPNIALWALVSHFFSGYIVAKFPFSLPISFRGMVQSGIEQLQLDVSYVTSASIYFLILFGLQGVQVLLLGNRATSQSAQMIQQQTLGLGSSLIEGSSTQTGSMFNPQQIIPDMNQAFKAQLENLKIIEHEYELNNEEQELIEKLEKKFKST